MVHVKNLIFGISYTVVTFLTMALVIYILESFGKGEVPGFQLATISTIFGGFMLSSSVFGKAATDLKLRMRRIGAIYLIAAVAFVMFHILFSILDILPQVTSIDKLVITESIIIDLPYINFNIYPQLITAWIMISFMYIGIITLSIAIWSMVFFIIPRLLMKSKSDIV